jgi:hypothetical protein
MGRQTSITRRIGVKIATIAIIAALVSTSVLATDWGPIKLNAITGKVDLTTADTQFGLVWLPKIVPSEDVLLEKITLTRMQKTSVNIYTFLGVMGNSIHIKSSDANKTIYIERSPDGSFYFIPISLKNDGYFKITPSQDDPGYYTVAISKKK